MHNLVLKGGCVRTAFSSIKPGSSIEPKFLLYLSGFLVFMLRIIKGNLEDSDELQGLQRKCDPSSGSALALFVVTALAALITTDARAPVHLAEKWDATA